MPADRSVVYGRCVDWPSWRELLLAAVIFAVFSVGGIAITGLVLVRLRADYFSEAAGHGFWVERHALVRATGLILKTCWARW
jgi:hypothetical protein